MRKTLLVILVTASLSILATTLFFWWLRAPNLSSALSLINTLTRGQVTILNQFPSIDNLEGFVVKSTQNQQQNIIYVDNRGHYLIIGNLIGKNGNSISNEDYQTYIAPQSASLAFNYISNVTYIQQGQNTAPHQAYIVFDPNCIFCHQLFEALQPFINEGQLAIRWVPVAFLKETSQGRVYALLNNANPAAMLDQNESNFNEQTEEGGITPLTSAPAATVKQLQNNMAFLTEAHILATPVMLYKTKGGVPQVTSGFTDANKMNALIQSFTPIF